MVLAFIVTTLTGDSPLLLYYQIYGHILSAESIGDQELVPAEENKRQGKVDKTTTDSDGRRKIIKDYIMEIAEQVHSEYQFRREANNLTVEEDIQRLNNDDTLPEFEVGHFRAQAPQGDSSITTNASSETHFQHVTWMGAGLTGFVLLCDTCENRSTAVQVLRLLVRFLQEHVRVLNQPSEVANRFERVSEVLDRVLPDGNLVFMNHRIVRQIEKELENVMKVTS